MVESYLVKYVGGTETERKLMYTDTYKAKSEIIYVGMERTEEGNDQRLFWTPTGALPCTLLGSSSPDPFARFGLLFRLLPRVKTMGE